MIIACDIDGTICSEERYEDRHKAIPIWDMIDRVNQHFADGDRVMLFTARPWNQYDITKEWLDVVGVYYHELIMGKPNYDIFYDDRTVNPCEFN